LAGFLVGTAALDGVAGGAEELLVAIEGATEEALESGPKDPEWDGVCDEAR
jgi:hypothetical protein